MHITRLQVVVQLGLHDYLCVLIGNFNLLSLSQTSGLWWIVKISPILSIVELQKRENVSQNTSVCLFQSHNALDLWYFAICYKLYGETPAALSLLDLAMPDFEWDFKICKLTKNSY